MNCSYCSKTDHQFVFTLQEDVPGLGPSIRHACFRCVQTIGERIMVEIRKAEDPEPLRPPDLTMDATSCTSCAGCGGIRKENCKNYPAHQHTWCDCQ